MVGEFLAFDLPTVQLLGTTTVPEAPELPEPSVLKSQSILHKLLGKFGVHAALVLEDRTIMTRNAMTETFVPYAWNPSRIKSNASVHSITRLENLQLLKIF